MRKGYKILTWFIDDLKPNFIAVNNYKGTNEVVNILVSSKKWLVRGDDSRVGVWKITYKD